jgi:hypothetical protein
MEGVIQVQRPVQLLYDHSDARVDASIFSLGVSPFIHLIVRNLEFAKSNSLSNRQVSVENKTFMYATHVIELSN